MSHSKLVLGLGIGALLGGALVCLSRTASARRMRNHLCCAIHELESDAHDMLHQAKKEAEKTGEQLAGKMAQRAETVKEKLNEEANK